MLRSPARQGRSRSSAPRKVCSSRRPSTITQFPSPSSPPSYSWRCSERPGRWAPGRIAGCRQCLKGLSISATVMITWQYITGIRTRRGLDWVRNGEDCIVFWERSTFERSFGLSKRGGFDDFFSSIHCLGNCSATHHIRLQVGRLSENRILACQRRLLATFDAEDCRFGETRARLSAAHG